MGDLKPFVRIDEWHRDPKDAYVYAEDGNIKINLDKCIPNSIERLRLKNEQGTTDLATFNIGRTAFKNTINLIADYIDYFVEFYDDEKEIPSLYIHWKKLIDSNKKYMTPVEYHDMVMKNIFQESNIKKNIYRMVEDNYYIDITVDKNSGRKFEAKEDFTNDNVKRFLAISMGMKLVIPPSDHYASISQIMNISGITLNSLMLNLFRDIMYKIGDLNGDDGTDELIEKLYIFVYKNMGNHVKNNSTLWEHESALRGMTEDSHTDTLIIKFIMYDNFFKLRFNSAMTSFLKSIINLQLTCTIERVTYNGTPIKIDTTQSSGEKTSGVARAEQQLAKIDESQVTMTEKTLVNVISKLEREVGGISNEELEYYENNLVHSDWFQSYLLKNMFAKYFDGFQEEKIMGNLQYSKLVIIGKRMLLKQGYLELPWLISSTPQGKLSNRQLRNTKILNRIKSSEAHKKFIEEKYACLKNFKDDEDIVIMSKILNNQYTFNEWDRPEIYGEPISFDEDIICAEISRFIDSI